ncbi:MAG: hypothetical protein ACR5LA_02970 [Wolbachia sp.]
MSALDCLYIDASVSYSDEIHLVVFSHLPYHFLERIPLAIPLNRYNKCCIFITSHTLFHILYEQLRKNFS